MAEQADGPVAHGIPRLPVDAETLANVLKPLASERRLRILQYLTRPHYLEEIASYVGVARQTAQRHVDQLLEVGAIKKQQGQRDSGPVQEYVVVPQRFFAIGEDMFQLGTLQPEDDGEAPMRTERTDRSVDRPDAAVGPALTVVHGIAPGRVHRLDGPDEPWSIGRDEESHIRLDHDPFVSTRHAEVRTGDDGRVLVDTYSTNGTFANWQQLPRGGEHQLKAGDVVGIGKTLMVYWA